MIDQLQELAANIQGLAYALTLLDSYPGTDHKLKPAIHALHAMLSNYTNMLCEALDDRN